MNIYIVSLMKIISDHVIENGWYRDVLRESEEMELDVRKVKEYSKEEWRNIIRKRKQIKI